MIVSTGRTASTALLRAFANHPDVVAVYQPIKDGYRDAGRTDEDYRIYEHEHPVFERELGKVFVSKELTSYAVRGTPVDVFRSDGDMERVRPVFLVREPLRAWRSMKRLMADYTANAIDHYIAAFVRLCEYQERCAAGTALTLTTECMNENPELVMRRLCVHWGLRFAPQLLAWTRPIEDNMWLAPFAHTLNAHDPRWWTSVRASVTITKNAVAANDPPLDKADRRRLEAELTPAYRRLAATCARDFT